MSRATHKLHLSTGDIAAICQVSPRTAANWIDKGLIKGFRVGKCRRVQKAELIKFLEREGLLVYLDRRERERLDQC